MLAALWFPGGQVKGINAGGGGGGGVGFDFGTSLWVWGAWERVEGIISRFFSFEKT